jgi:hypothetical protein
MCELKLEGEAHLSSSPVSPTSGEPNRVKVRFQLSSAEKSIEQQNLHISISCLIIDPHVLREYYLLFGNGGAGGYVHKSSVVISPASPSSGLVTAKRETFIFH